jgi:putative transposase
MADIYHILNRGIDKWKIFLDKQDYLRFIHNLFVLNDQSMVNNIFYSFQKAGNNKIEFHNLRKPRKLLVNIHAFCLMPNHYHLLLSPRIENAVPKFMHKLGTAYVKYFNQKYKRKGTIFEGRYKSILVNKEPHFYHLPYYIHFNPLDLKFKEWREGKLRSYKQAVEHLNNYRWSSHLDYLGIKNFSSVTNRKFLTDAFGEPEEYEKSIKQWLKDLELEEIRELLLE